MVNVVQKALSKFIRITGQALDVVGRQLEVNPVIERLQPSVRCVKLRNAQPTNAGLFVAPTATLIGRVTIGKYSSIGYGTTLRADVSSIDIGNESTIGDRVMIHCSSHPKEFPTKVGNNVVIEAGCILHGCTIADEAYVGEGSQVLDGARIEKNAAVAPGSLVSLGKVVPTGQLWGGVPATFQRNLSPEEISAIKASSIENAELAVFHAAETRKTWEEIDYDEELYEYRSNLSADAPKRPTIKDTDDVSYQGPGSIFNTPFIERF